MQQVQEDNLALFLWPYRSSLVVFKGVMIGGQLFSQPPANTSPTMDDSPEVSCPVGRSLNTQKRTEFGKNGGTAFGYPSSGGVLIKDLDVVNALYLRIDRLAASKRSSNVLEEDEFCERMRRIGATWWADEQEYVDVLLGVRERTEVEARVLVFGWPSDGRGVWVLRYASDRDVPRDLGRVNLAVNMDERCCVMKEFGATFLS